MHASTAVDEGSRLQNRKSVLVAEAETIIDMAHIIEAKLAVACRKLPARKPGRASNKLARTGSPRSTEHKRCFSERTWTDCKYDGGRFEVYFLRVCSRSKLISSRSGSSSQIHIQHIHTPLFETIHTLCPSPSLF